MAGSASSRSCRLDSVESACLRGISIAMLMLSACAPIPLGPGVLALPGSDKPLEQFQTDDAQCQQYASASAGAGGQADASTYDAQRRYDFAYIQCMYSKGHKVPVSGGYTNAPSGQIPPPAQAAPPPPQ